MKNKQPQPTVSATLTIEQWNIISHALGVAANVVADSRGADAAEKYDTLSDHLTYDLKVTEEEPEPFVWDAAEWLESLTDVEYDTFYAEFSSAQLTD